MTESSLRVASPKTTIPNNPSQFVISIPLIENPLIFTLASLSILIMDGGPTIPGSSSSNGGASIMVDFAPEPIIVRVLLIVICSMYVQVILGLHRLRLLH